MKCSGNGQYLHFFLHNQSFRDHT